MNISSRVSLILFLGAVCFSGLANAQTAAFKPIGGAGVGHFVPICGGDSCGNYDPLKGDRVKFDQATTFDLSTASKGGSLFADFGNPPVTHDSKGLDATIVYFDFTGLVPRALVSGWFYLDKAQIEICSTSKNLSDCGFHEINFRDTKEIIHEDGELRSYSNENTRYTFRELGSYFIIKKEKCTDKIWTEDGYYAVNAATSRKY